MTDFERGRRIFLALLALPKSASVETVRGFNYEADRVAARTDHDYMVLVAKRVFGKGDMK